MAGLRRSPRDRIGIGAAPDRMVGDCRDGNFRSVRNREFEIRGGTGGSCIRAHGGNAIFHGAAHSRPLTGYWRLLLRARAESDYVKSMAWIYLVIAGLFEVAWAIGLKYTEGFSRLLPSVITACAMVVSLVLLAQALKTIPIGTGYAVWTGIGAAGTAILGMVFLGESREALRIVCILVIVAGVVGLKLVSAEGR